MYRLITSTERALLCFHTNHGLFGIPVFLPTATEMFILSIWGSTVGVPITTVTPVGAPSLGLADVLARTTCARKR